MWWNRIVLNLYVEFVHSVMLELSKKVVLSDSYTSFRDFVSIRTGAINVESFGLSLHFPAATLYEPVTSGSSYIISLPGKRRYIRLHCEVNVQSFHDLANRYFLLDFRTFLPLDPLHFTIFELSKTYILQTTTQLRKDSRYYDRGR